MLLTLYTFSTLAVEFMGEQVFVYNTQRWVCAISRVAVTLFTPHISSYDTLIVDNRTVKLTSISSEGSELLVAVSSSWLEVTLRALVEDSIMYKGNIREKRNSNTSKRHS
jgi:23S rRNA G2445 N2-methylase RlmL